LPHTHTHTIRESPVRFWTGEPNFDANIMCHSTSIRTHKIRKAILLWLIKSPILHY